MRDIAGRPFVCGVEVDFRHNTVRVDLGRILSVLADHAGLTV